MRTAQMSRYFAVLEKEPKTLWSVYFPDFPGCVAAAETSREALENAAVALKEVAEDMITKGNALPRARTIRQIQSVPDVQESLALGAKLVTFPVVG